MAFLCTLYKEKIWSSRKVGHFALLFGGETERDSS